MPLNARSRGARNSVEIIRGLARTDATTAVELQLRGRLISRRCCRRVMWLRSDCYVMTSTRRSSKWRQMSANGAMVRNKRNAKLLRCLGVGPPADNSPLISTKARECAYCALPIRWHTRQRRLLTPALCSNCIVSPSFDTPAYAPCDPWQSLAFPLHALCNGAYTATHIPVGCNTHSLCSARRAQGRRGL